MVAKLENECQNLNKTAHRSDLNIEFKKNRKYLPRSRQHVYASCQTFLGEKRKRDCRQDAGRCVTSLTKLEPQCYLTANDGHLDRHVGQIVRRDGPAVKFWIHYSSLFVRVTEADSFHMREPTAPFWDSTLSRDQPVGNNTHKGWRTPETDSTRLHWPVCWALFHNVVDQNGRQVVAFLLSWPCIVRMDDVIISIF